MTAWRIPITMSAIGAVNALPTRTWHRKLRFFTRPHAEPSGVSTGQVSPSDVVCSWRGLGILPSREIGQLMRLSWLMAESVVILESICATPV